MKVQCNQKLQMFNRWHRVNMTLNNRTNVSSHFSPSIIRKSHIYKMNMIYCTCHCWNSHLTSVEGLEVVEVMMCLFFWTEAPCASLPHSQCPHTCYWCIHLQGNRERTDDFVFIRTLECVSQHRPMKWRSEWLLVLLLGISEYNII